MVIAGRIYYFKLKKTSDSQMISEVFNIRNRRSIEPFQGHT